jgi:hypothetical protein
MGEDDRWHPTVSGRSNGALRLKKISDLKSEGKYEADLTMCNTPGLPMQQDAKTTAHESTAAFAVGDEAETARVVPIATGGGAAAPKHGMRVTAEAVTGVEMTGVLFHGDW